MSGRSSSDGLLPEEPATLPPTPSEAESKERDGDSRASEQTGAAISARAKASSVQQSSQSLSTKKQSAPQTIPPLPTSASALQSLSSQFIPLGDRSDVSILVCGDEGVGKTSIIEALLSRSFMDGDGDYGVSLAGQPSLSRQWSVAHIPAELNRHRGVDIDLQIVDTLTKEAVSEKLKDADVVVLVYDATSDETFERAVNFWLGLIQRRCKTDHAAGLRQAATVPVVLVGNKIDRRAGGAGAAVGGGVRAVGVENSSNSSASGNVNSSSGKVVGRNGQVNVWDDHWYRRRVIPVLAAHPDVEACLECSAARLLNIRQVFYYAQKAVVYPMKPLYHMEQAKLTDQFKVALRRIFRIFDMDRDGYLSDEELVLFQDVCFGARLKSSDIANVKKVIQKQTTDASSVSSRTAEAVSAMAMANAKAAASQSSSESSFQLSASSTLYPSGTVNHLSYDDEIGPGIVNGRCTLSGFIHLNKLFIERNRPDSSWLVLRRFGYESACDHLLSVRLDPELTQKSTIKISYAHSNGKSKSSDGNDPHQNKVPLLQAVKADQASELSDSAINFLVGIFDQFSVDEKGYRNCLGMKQIRHIFRICPAGKAPWEDFNLRRTNPSGMKNYGFPQCVTSRHMRQRRRRASSNIDGKVASRDQLTDSRGGNASELNTEPRSNVRDSNINRSGKVVLDRNGWLAMWALMTHYDPRHVMRYMWYLGYLGDPVKSGSAMHEMHLKWPANRLHVEKAIRFTKRRADVMWASRLDRKTVRCWVLGDHSSGKEILLDLLTQNYNGKSALGGNSVGTYTEDSSGDANVEQSAIKWYEAKTSTEEKGGNNSGSSAEKRTLKTDGVNSSTHASESTIDNFAKRNVGQTSPSHSSDARWVRSKDRALIMTVLRNDGQFVLGQKERQNECDIAVFVFDSASTASFEWCVYQQSKLSPHIPIMYVALTKSAPRRDHDHLEAPVEALANESINVLKANTSHLVHNATESSLDKSVTSIASKAEKNAIYLDAVAHTNQFQLEPPVRLSELRGKKNRSAANLFFESVLQNALVPKRPASEERLRALKRKQIIDGLWYAGIATLVAGVGWLGYHYLSGRKDDTPASPSVEQSMNQQSGNLVRRASRVVQVGVER